MPTGTPLINCNTQASQFIASAMIGGAAEKALRVQKLLESASPSDNARIISETKIEVVAVINSALEILRIADNNARCK